MAPSSGTTRRLPSRVVTLAGFGVAAIALGLAAVVLVLVKPSHSHGASAAAHRHRSAQRSPTGSASTGSSHARSAGTSRHDPHAGAVGKASSATATGAGTHRLVAEARDPEESKSYPAPATVQHSAAKTPQAAGEVHVAAGAASDAEIRSELARMKRLESAAGSPAQMKTVPGGSSIVGNDGAIPIPTDVPQVIQRVIAGANAIANFPYVYGGGHASFVDNAYDCSGSVSYALAAGGLLSAPETSGQLESWGAPGPGRWITVYANAGHTYMYVNVGGAWMLYDTAGRSGVFASRWQPYPVDNQGYVARHWPGL